MSIVSVGDVENPVDGEKLDTIVAVGGEKPLVIENVPTVFGTPVSIEVGL